MGRTVAVLDDEADIVELLEHHLSGAGFSVEAFTAPERFLSWLKDHRPDAVVLDLMLPGTDGFEICRRIRTDPRLVATKIIILTARTGETDTVLGLELGADDYMTKPFSPRELTARVKAVLRRTEPLPAQKAASAKTAIHMDRERFMVTAGKTPVSLTQTEFKILALLAGRPGIVFSREQILDSVWGNNVVVVDRTVDVHIRRLREKLGPAGELIVNIRGMGYKLNQ